MLVIWENNILLKAVEKERLKTNLKRSAHSNFHQNDIAIRNKWEMVHNNEASYL